MNTKAANSGRVYVCGRRGGGLGGQGARALFFRNLKMSALLLSQYYSLQICIFLFKSGIFPHSKPIVTYFKNSSASGGFAT